MVTGSWAPLLWFAAIVAAIPVVLWLLKRTPIGATASGGVLRSVASLPLSASQRIITVEVGQGDERRWLVLGVTPSNITTLHTLAPQAEAAPPSMPPRHAFAQLLARLQPTEGRDAR